MKEYEISADVFNGREHYRRIDSTDEVTFPDSLISFMYLDFEAVARLLFMQLEEVARSYAKENDTAVRAEHLAQYEAFLNELAEVHIYFVPFVLDAKRRLQKVRETISLKDSAVLLGITKIKDAPARITRVQKQLLKLAENVFDADKGTATNETALNSYYKSADVGAYKFQPLNLKYELVNNSYFTEVLDTADMFELISFHVNECIRRNIKMRKCKNCGRYFALTGHGKVEYCDRPCGTNGKTCREAGSAKVWAESKKSDEIFSSYRREYKKRFARIRAGKLTADEFAAWATAVRKEKAKCESGEITKEAFLAWLGES